MLLLLHFVDEEIQRLLEGELDRLPRVQVVDVFPRSENRDPIRLVRENQTHKGMYSMPQEMVVR